MKTEYRVLARIIVVGAVTGGLAALMTRYIEKGAKAATNT